MRRWVSPVGAMAVVALCVALVAGGCGSAGSVQARWVVRDLGTLGGTRSDAVEINERGQVVGGSLTGGGKWHAFLWQRGRMTDLGALPGGTESSVGVLNERGQVVGSSATRGKAWPHAFLWESGTLIDLGTLGHRQPGGRGGSARSVGAAINERGQVVGYSDVGGNVHAFLWENGRMRDLGTLGGGRSWARAINDRGQIVGAGRKRGAAYGFVWQGGKMMGSDAVRDARAINNRGQILCGGETHAFLWESGWMRDLGTLGGYRSSALAINERGQIVGTSGTAGGEGHAFLWERGLWDRGKMIDLGTLAGGRESEARAINDKGQVVGWSYSTADGREQRAFLWENGKMTTLDTLGGHRAEAFAINDKGQIVGWSDTQNGQTHAVLWTLRRDT